MVDITTTTYLPRKQKLHYFNFFKDALAPATCVMQKVPEQPHVESFINSEVESDVEPLAQQCAGQAPDECKVAAGTGHEVAVHREPLLTTRYSQVVVLRLAGKPRPHQVERVRDGKRDRRCTEPVYLFHLVCACLIFLVQLQAN